MRPADLAQRARIRWYRMQSDCADVRGAAELKTPALLAGHGSITFGTGVIIGWRQGPGFYSTYVYVDARMSTSRIVFGDGCYINNDAAFVSEGDGMVFGERCLIGPRVQVYDSDFHSLDADREGKLAVMAPVTVGDDVFVGTGAIILKGSVIGDGAVIGAGCVVAGEVPAGTMVVGNPARQIDR